MCAERQIIRIKLDKLPLTMLNCDKFRRKCNLNTTKGVKPYERSVLSRKIKRLIKQDNGDAGNRTQTGRIGSPAVQTCHPLIKKDKLIVLNDYETGVEFPSFIF